MDLGGGLRLRVATVADLIELKLVAVEDPTLRTSKREHDVADVLALLEEHPDLKSPELMTRLHGVRLRLLASGLDAGEP